MIITNQSDWDLATEWLRILQEAPRELIQSVVDLCHGETEGKKQRKPAEGITRKQIRDLYLGQGMSARQCAEELGITVCQVRGLMRKYGIESRGRGGGNNPRGRRAWKDKIQEHIDDEKKKFNFPKVRTLKDMSPKERAKMHRLYDKAS